MPQCARAPNRIRSSRVGRWRFRLRRAPVPLPGRGTEHGADPVPGIKHRCLPSGAYAQVAAWSLRSLRAGAASDVTDLRTLQTEVAELKADVVELKHASGE